MLELIPDRPDTRRFVSIHDYAFAQTIFDLPLPGPGATYEELQDYCRHFDREHENGDVPGMETLDSWMSGYGACPGTINPQYMGFDLRNVDRSVVTGSPENTLEVVWGSFEPETTEQALEACSECEPHVLGEHQGVGFYSWGNEFGSPSKTLKPPALDFLGRGGRIAIFKDLVFRTLTTEAMRTLIETSLGKFPSLAEVDEFRLAAQAMADLGAYSMVLSDLTQGLDRLLSYAEAHPISGRTDRILQSLGESPVLLRPYLLFGTGIGKDEAGLYMALSLVHADTKSAQRNVDLLQQRIDVTLKARGGGRWADLVESTDIRTQGRVLVAKLRGPVALEWRDFSSADALLAHESPAIQEAEWEQVRSFEGGFVSLMPGTPDQGTLAVDTEIGPH